MLVTANQDSQASRISAFRDEYRRTEVPGWYSGYWHLAGTTIVSVAVILAAAFALDGVTALEWLTVPIAFLGANLVEYFGHRGPMHNEMRGLRLIYHRHTRQHHRFFTNNMMQFDSSADFKAVLFPLIMIIFYLGLIATPVALLLAVLASTNTALLFVIVAIGYFLNYELLHFAYHTGPDSWVARLPLMGRLRRLHQTHHRPDLMMTNNFNITYPIGDLLFGTLYRD